MRRPEEIVQRTLCDHLRLRLMPPWIFWATPNQRGTRKVYEAQILKALGVRAGIPDLFILGPGSKLIGIECKSPPRALKSRARKSTAKARLSEAQEHTIGELAGLGVPTLIARNVDETIAALAALGVPFRGRVV